MTIEPLGAGEVAEMAGIEGVSFAVPWPPESLRAELVAWGATALGAFDPGRALLGFVCTRMVLDEAEVTRIAVAPEQRRRGIARALLAHALAALAGRGVRRVHLEVRAANVAARALYESLGFETTGMRRGYFRDPEEDAVLMSRVILSHKRPRPVL